MQMEEKYKAGEAIYGDDFTIEQIQQWYDEETEAYADLGSKDAGEYVYGYHELNKLHGFKYLPAGRFENVLGLGAAWGHEFFPIIDRIDNLHIVEPSDNLQSQKLGNLVPIYKKPAVSGELPYPDNFFDYEIADHLRQYGPGNELLTVRVAEHSLQISGSYE